ncbi:putative Pre-mRNA polyadenylation factor fip-1 [Triangularia verruculosa]|uniref:Pre-mRNA polyadenylation factor fip-1 n=1 Tax=Triangularia verruculosa TaxID=2587418 RepID=A0AAN6XQE2_9PEZI|nr:putative Pre-mRNA polyadenylation factor fip-1 [Triangularia verruculosa]
MASSQPPMDLDEDEDFYGNSDEETTPAATTAQPATATAPQAESKSDANSDLEEGEEEDEGGEMDEDEDSDIDIITERKDNSQPAPPPQSKYSEIRNIPQRSTTAPEGAPAKQSPSVARDSLRQQQQQTELPPVSTSKIDVNAIPIHKPTGKPLTQVNIDEDLPDNDKPWRKPGTDLSDYFNYGFDEFTWALYAQKQEAMRGEYNQDAIAQNNTKMMEEMTKMMMMGGMMPGAGGPGGAGMGVPGGGAQMGGMDGMPPEMQAMMQQMMANGMDPSQMGDMSGMFQGGQQPGPGAQQGQGFGQGGFGGNQGQGYGGYDQMGGGRGRGRGRRW